LCMTLHIRKAEVVRLMKVHLIEDLIKLFWNGWGRGWDDSQTKDWRKFHVLA